MIKVENLVKTFGAKRAVDDVSFTVERGEVLGFLGPNGAGKSTTMRIITGFYPPTAGSVSVGGHDIVENPLPAKRLIGYLPENAPGYADMTVHGFLGFAAELRGLSRRGEEKGHRPRRRDLLPRRRAAPDHRHAVQGLQAPHLPRAVDHPRPGRADPGRADRRPRPEPEARSARPDQAHGREQGDRVLHPHPRGSRRRLHARDHHRPRPHRRQRHAGGAEGARRDRGRRAARGARPERAGARRRGGRDLRARAKVETLAAAAGVAAVRIYPDRRRGDTRARGCRHRPRAGAGLAGRRARHRGGAAWTTCSARSRSLPRHACEGGPHDERLEQHQGDHEARARRLFHLAGGLRLPGDLPAADRLLHLHGRQLLRARRGLAGVLLQLAPVAVPGAGARRPACGCGPRSGAPARSSCC